MMKKRQWQWEKKRHWDGKGERQSIILFSCLELKYPYYDNGLSASHFDRKESVVPVAQSVRIMNIKRRQWDALPSTALLNIFCKSELKDRLQSIPLVCKSWKYVTDDPRCWSSMIPDSVSPEDAFIKKRYEFPVYRNTLNLVENSRLFKGGDEGDEEFQEEEVVPVGLSRFRSLIKKSGGGAAITTLYLQPFWYSYDREEEEKDNDEVIRLITNRCPNLKHISFHGYYMTTSMQALLRLFNNCKKLEIVDLSTFACGYHDDPLDIQRLLCCLPNLRGFRIFGREPGLAVAIATYLPQLNLLSYGSDWLTRKDLSTILFSCLELKYLRVLGDRGMLYDILDEASAQIPEFYCERILESSPCWTPPSYDDNYLLDWQESIELNYCFEDAYFSMDYYDDILQQREEKKEHHYILKK